MRTHHSFLIALLTALLLLIPCAALADGFFPLDQLKVGMKGVGKTVVRATKVETFNVEIVDIIPDGGFDGGPIVLAKFSGPVVELSSGIAEGYSGSPVYINGKLLGAVSSAFPFSDTHLGGITPIQSMLAALPKRHRVDFTGNTVVPEPRGVRRSRSFSGAEAAGEDTEEPPALPLGAVPLSAPLIAHGLSPRSLELLQKKVAPYPFVHVVADPGFAVSSPRGGLLYDPAFEGPLRAGDAVTISLISGDIDLSVLGTVTYIDEAGQVLLFGHPFMLSGDIDMPLQKAYVACTYKSIQRPFKIGYSLYPVGTAKQDRAAAVGALLHETADTLPLSVIVNDIDYRTEREFKVEIVRHEDWVDLLTGIVFDEAFTRTTNTAKGGTMRLEMTLNGTGLKEPLHRVNYYYESSLPSDIVWEELLPLMSLLTNNIYREVKLTEVTVRLDFTRNRVNAAIDEAKVLLPGEELAAEEESAEAAPASGSGADAVEGSGPSEAEPPEDNSGQEEGAAAEPGPPVPGAAAEEEPAPALAPPGTGAKPKSIRRGETLRVHVVLQPYRQKTVEQTIYFTLPEDFPEGPTSLAVHGGGGLISIYNEFGGRGRNLFGAGSFFSVPGHLHDLDSIVEKAMSTPLNNEIVVTVFKPGVDPESGEPPPGEGEDWEPEFHVSLPTQWVIYGYQAIPVTIEPKEGEATTTSAGSGDTVSEAEDSTAQEAAG